MESRGVACQSDFVDLVAVLPTFLLAVLLISASPGPAVFLILKRAALRGTRATVPTIAGLEIGLYLWALAAGAGLTALVAASSTAYTVLRVVGAGFLVVLGVRAWVTAWQIREDVEIDSAAPAAAGRRAFVEGLVVQLVGRVSGWFRRGTIRRRLEAASGTVLVALGVRVVWTAETSALAEGAHCSPPLCRTLTLALGREPVAGGTTAETWMLSRRVVRWAGSHPARSGPRRTRGQLP
jgi:threonine/homoserine/homoserine lactone efflux protein